MDKAICETRNYRADNFIRFLLDGKRSITVDEFEVRKNNLGLVGLNAPFAVVMIAPDYTALDYDIKDETLALYEQFVKGELPYLCKDNYIFTNTYNNVEILLAFGGETPSAESLNKFFIELRQKLINKFGFEVFVGIGSIADGFKDISVSCADAQEMLAFKFQYADSGVVNIATMVKFQYNMSMGNTIEFDRVIGCFKDGNLGKMEIRLNELVESVRHRPNVSGTSIRRSLVEVTVNILHTASNAGVDVDEVLGGTDPYRYIMRQNHTEIITEWIMKTSSELLELIKSKRENTERSVISQAKSYIEESLSDVNLSLNQISDAVRLSSTYLSQLFKKETGLGISAYITQLRIERAKIMLLETELLVADIAKQAGFMSTGYFTQVFKKLESITPQEYRRKKLVKS